ncbi:hypothetical protein GCK72_019227 [Caenorhabditis remanei]|uniref:Uncharacterized protein n=1 Tax=Caenorhabditis remanei TaxID=31234 RepID=A0A6A5GDX7_CAERE|nr:hypothetical protein GCK72_019227 [Caenorhabditis remanei]KAF1752672.1 hypothetical protein GCK72_019227 [Caenorhabditis remanei]
MVSLWIVLDRQVLTTDHSISLEPFTTELLGSTIWSVSPFDGDTVIVGVLKEQNKQLTTCWQVNKPPVRRRKHHRTQPKEQLPLGRELHMVDRLQVSSCWLS